MFGKDIWRSRGCSLIGSDEEDFVFEVAKRSLASLVLWEIEFSLGVGWVEETGKLKGNCEGVVESETLLSLSILLFILRGLVLSGV